MTLDGIQGNVLVGYKTTHVHFVFARVADPDAARGWLDDRLPNVTFNRWSKKPPHTLNIAFTHKGLLELGVPEERLTGLDTFAAGMAGRASLLGDTGPCCPQAWQPGLRDTHILVTLTAWDQRSLDGGRAELDEHLGDPSNGLVVSHRQPAATLPCAREHFGFSDGFSQPAIERAKTGPRQGEGVLVKRTLFRPQRWRDLALGEFILGYRGEGGLCAAAPSGPLRQDSTFMVVRKLEQDVAAFRAYVAEQARLLHRDEDWISAKMVGRWQNGSPLASHPHEPGPPADGHRGHINRFRYGEDPDGLACPLGAHVRRTNPRDALGWEGRLTKRHRILRRGISYGPALPKDITKADGAERGLMFVCYQASIERQFEFIQQQWIGDGNVFGLGDDRDPIVAGPRPPDGTGSEMLIQGRPPLFLSALPRFVTTRGGDYFLLPGRAGLKALASRRW